MASQVLSWPNPLRLVYFTDHSSWLSLQANFKNIDGISPGFYRLSRDGALAGQNQPAITDFARARGIKVIPMIQNDPVLDNFNQIIGNQARSNALIEAIAQQVINHNFEGIHIDFENLNAASEKLLTDFMRRLFNRLNPLNKLTTMAVVARTPASTSEFKAAYNYPALAPFTDLVTVMTYDFAWPGGPPGPVAPLKMQETVMNYAISCFGAEKLLLGIPFYGYDWNITRRQLDPKVTAVSHTFNDTLDLQRQHNGTFGYDSAAETPFLDYVKDGDKHRVWFENARSISAKLQLLKRLKVRGLAAWRLGQDGAEMWPEFANLATPGPVKFNETGHSVQGPFLKFWQANDGINRFGFPLTEEFDEPVPGAAGQILRVQYFQRSKFELHPEFAPAGNEVLLGLLGRIVTAGRENEAAFQRKPDPNMPGTVRYFNETGHTLRSEFRAYWERNGGLSFFGFPISEQFQGLNSTDGPGLKVQYFERARFEFHPEQADPANRVMLGLLGNQVLGI